MADLSTKNIGMSKYFATLILLIIVIAVLSSCKNQEASEQEDEFDEVADIEPSALPAAPIQAQTNPQPNNAQQQTQSTIPQAAQLTQSTLPQKPANTEFIDIIDREFVPLNIEIPINTTVIWMHKDEFRPLIQHMIKVRTKGIADELTKSERLSKGQNLTYMFTTPGTYEYMDILFIKDMDIGKIIVK